MYADNFTVVDNVGEEFNYVSDDEDEYCFLYGFDQDGEQTKKDELHIIVTRKEKPPKTVCVHFNPRRVVIFYDR